MFELFDTLTNQKVSLAVYYDERSAWDAIERTRARIAKGQRLDLANKIPYWAVREVVYP